MNNELIEKMSNNKVLLYIIPQLVYISVLLNYYNTNYSDPLILIVWDVLILIGILFIISNICYFILKKILNNDQKVFMTMMLICPSLSTSASFLKIVGLLLVIGTFVYFLRKLKIIKCSNLITMISFIVIVFFCLNLTNFLPNSFKYIFKSKTYSKEFTITDNKELPSPNIYWIHCDAMPNIKMTKEYFNDQKQPLKHYLDENNFITNENATLVAGHKTIFALPALFNPNYYDNFYNQYLTELEKEYLDGTKTSFSLNYTELINKRLDNELMNALKEKGYTTISVTRSDEHSSTYTDIIYDYYTGMDNKELRLLKDITRKDIINHSNYSRFMTNGLSSTILSSKTTKTNFEYDVVDYTNIDLKDYLYLNKTDYWPSKAIVKAIDESASIEENKFIFIDYFLNHAPFTYDEDGNKLNKKESHDLDSFLGNYTYSSYLLIDILNYIKKIDENAIIILQADHGIHAVPDNVLASSFNIDKQEILNINNSVINSVYIPNNFKTENDNYLKNPLNISRYLINNYVNETYKYLEVNE